MKKTYNININIINININNGQGRTIEGHTERSTYTL